VRPRRTISGAVDDIMSRLAEITDESGVDVAFKYLGAVLIQRLHTTEKKEGCFPQNSGIKG
jgi:hypothetical protein